MSICNAVPLPPPSGCANLHYARRARGCFPPRCSDKVRHRVSHLPHERLRNWYVVVAVMGCFSIPVPNLSWSCSSTIAKIPKVRKALYHPVEVVTMFLVNGGAWGPNLAPPPVFLYKHIICYNMILLMCILRSTHSHIIFSTHTKSCNRHHESDSALFHHPSVTPASPWSVPSPFLHSLPGKCLSPSCLHTVTLSGCFP